MRYLSLILYLTEGTSLSFAIRAYAMGAVGIDVDDCPQAIRIQGREHCSYRCREQS